MAVFGFGEDKKLFGGNNNTNSVVNQAPTHVEEAPVVQAPATKPSVAESALTEDDNDVKIGEFTSKISEVESKIKEIYCEIGEKYFELHKDDAEYDFVSMVNAIKDKNTLINDFKDKINEIKGVIICDKCGSETKNTSTFCMECGNKIKKVVATVPNGQRACSNCNSFIDEGAKFCSVCGYKVDGVKENVSQLLEEADKKMDDLVEAVVEAEKEPIIENESSYIDIPIETAPIRECPSCGQILESFDIMCFACGRKL